MDCARQGRIDYIAIPRLWPACCCSGVWAPLILAMLYDRNPVAVDLTPDWYAEQDSRRLRESQSPNLRDIAGVSLRRLTGPVTVAPHAKERLCSHVHSQKTGSASRDVLAGNGLLCFSLAIQCRRRMPSRRMEILRKKLQICACDPEPTELAVPCHRRDHQWRLFSNLPRAHAIGPDAAKNFNTAPLEGVSASLCASRAAVIVQTFEQAAHRDGTAAPPTFKAPVRRWSSTRLAVAIRRWLCAGQLTIEHHIGHRELMHTWLSAYTAVSEHRTY